MSTNTKTVNRLGVDIGRVVMAPVIGGKADTAFLSGDLTRALKTPPTPDAFESLAHLATVFNGQVWLISKAGPSIQRKTLLWLEQHDVYRRCSIPPAQVQFCLRREEKAIHCRTLQITHFIDDRLDVLTHLRGIVKYCYLFGEQPVQQSTPDWVVPVADWPAALKTLLRQL